MSPIALILVACLPHGDHCKSIVQHPAPVSHEECNRRAANLQQQLAGSIDDSGYQPTQVICLYGDAAQDGGAE